MTNLKDLASQFLLLFVCLVFFYVFLPAPVSAADKYSSNTKSPTGVMEPRDMYFPGTEKLASDEMRIISLRHRHASIAPQSGCHLLVGRTR